MSFSFRTLFQNGSQSKAAPGQVMTRPFGSNGHQAGIGQPSANSLSTVMQATSAMSPPAQSPFQAAGSPLFKTASHEAIEAPPINAPSGLSPFSLPSATPTNMPLTVGDVIGQLPPELVRGGALANEQPITLPPSLIENALRSGQAAVPVFEIYRVCPALFQTPVSPQDPRLVQLPAAKLPSLIASARTQGSNAALASPFAAAQPQGGERSMASSNAPSAFPMSPFAAAIPAAGGSENVPLSGTSQQGVSPFSATGVASQPPSGPSPFGAASSQPEASPFGMAGSAAPSQAPSPFAPAATPQAA